MQRIGVLTSGGDAPGMNAAIRAVVRCGIDAGAQVYGVERGFAGLVGNNLRRLAARDVSNVLQQGGTILGSARCLEFQTPEGLAKALRTLNARGIDGLCVIGGNGSQQGANALAARGFPVVGIASTIDNDLAGTEVTIGVDTALNVALEAIDRLKTTASSHQRAFLVEVMGRQCGYLALMAGIAGGAEVIVLPEREAEPDAVAAEIKRAYERGKAHAIVVVAEGAKTNAEALAEHFKPRRDELGFGIRVTKLGHVQRGGIPGASDRLLATRLGAAAVDALVGGRHGVLCGMQRGRVSETPLAEIAGVVKPIDPDLLKLADILAR